MGWNLKLSWKLLEFSSEIEKKKDAVRYFEIGWVLGAAIGNQGSVRREMERKSFWYGG